jgi:hypothetical protein
MAVVSKSVIGDISGRISNLVIKNRNGKRVAYAWPKKYKASKSPLAKEGRNNFAVTVKFAKAVNSSSALKKIWTSSKAEGTNSFQKIIKNNAKQVNNGSLTTLNRITPEGLPLTLNSVSIQNYILNLTFNFKGNTNIKFPLTVHIYFFFNGYDKLILSLTENIGSARPEGSYDLNIVLNSNIKKALRKDPGPIIYFALEAAVSFKNKIYWTSTASSQIE